MKQKRRSFDRRFYLAEINFRRTRYHFVFDNDSEFGLISLLLPLS